MTYSLNQFIHNRNPVKPMIIMELAAQIFILKAQWLSTSDESVWYQTVESHIV